MITHETQFDQMSPEWFAARAGKITGSIAATVVGKETNEGYKRLVREKAIERYTAEVDTNSYQSHYMTRGIELEAEALDCYLFASGSVITAQPGIVFNAEYPDIAYSPDCIVSQEASSENRLLEIKCPKGSTHLLYLEEHRLPPVYRWQVALGLMVCDLPRCDFVSYYPGVRMFIVTVERDPELEAELLEAIEKFNQKVDNAVGILRRHNAR